MDPTGQGGFDRRTGLQNAEDENRIDGGARKFGGHIIGNACQSEHVDLKFLSSRAHCLKVFSRVALQPKRRGFTSHCLLDHFGMGRKLVADRRADEVGAIGIKALLHQEVDLAKIDHAQIIVILVSPAFGRNLRTLIKHPYAI
jgi:hypothetical protein